MKTQQHRLPAGTKVFAGLNIDRTQTLRFRLDGRLISGFAGDTVLSALLASGIDTLGEHLDTALGLSAASAPAILPSSQAADPRHALPMDRTPALDGADYVTLRGRRRNPFIRLFQPGRSLGLVLDTPGALDRPWRTWAGEASAHQDMVIVGGGVAGLSAALAAARAGLSVTLLESDQRLGGNSALFGTQEGEDAPEDCMARLSGEVWPSGKLRLSGGVLRWRRGASRLNERPVPSREGHSGDPFPSTTPERPEVQRAWGMDVGVQWFGTILPMTFRLEGARVENAGNVAAASRTFGRASVSATYRFRYP